MHLGTAVLAVLFLTSGTLHAAPPGLPNPVLRDGHLHEAALSEERHHPCSAV